MNTEHIFQFRCLYLSCLYQVQLFCFCQAKANTYWSHLDPFPIPSQTSHLVDVCTTRGADPPISADPPTSLTSFPYHTPSPPLHLHPTKTPPTPSSAPNHNNTPYTSIRPPSYPSTYTRRQQYTFLTRSLRHTLAYGPALHITTLTQAYQHQFRRSTTNAQKFNFTHTKHTPKLACLPHNQAYYFPHYLPVSPHGRPSPDEMSARGRSGRWLQCGYGRRWEHERRGE